MQLTLGLLLAIASLANNVDASPEAAVNSEAVTADLKSRMGAALIAEMAKKSGRPPVALARQLLGGGDEYAPYEVPCPTGWTWVRPADSLATGEQEYLEKRQPYLESINTQLAGLGLPTPPRVPRLGYALSGGGYRAMQVGLGGVMGTMNASQEAANSGIGGWIDGFTYIAGLSGGSWGTTTFLANNGRSPLDLVDNVWNLESNLIFPDDGKLSFYYDMLSNVRAKGNDFPTQITDYWGLALGNHLLPSQYHLENTPNYTYSSFPSTIPGLSNGSLPMPIIIAAERQEGEYVIAENATVWEMTPYEFGAWAFGADEKVRGGFSNMQYLGSDLNNGQPNGTCYNGFDQASFVMGTSATLFNGALLQLEGTNTSGIVASGIELILESISDQENDIAQYPNPFAKWDAQPNPIADLEYLTLVDAGLTNQNVPIEPLLSPYRSVDAILAFDSSADTTYSWPNGSALRTTYERSLQLARQQNVSINMPVVPSVNGFVNGGLNTRPTFFGCNETTGPIIVYVPNYPWSYYSNTSTYKLAYTKEESYGVINSGMRSLTLNNSVSNWPTCLACAFTDRAFDYTSSNRSAECQECFNTWCWNGEDDQSQPSGEYEPVMGTKPSFLISSNLTSGDNSPVNAAQPNAPTNAAQTSDTGAATPNYGASMMGVGALAVGMIWTLI